MTEDREAVVQEWDPHGVGGRSGDEGASPRSVGADPPTATDQDPQVSPGEGAAPVSEQEAAATTTGGTAPADEGGAPAYAQAAPSAQDEILLEELDVSEIDDVERLHEIAIDMQGQIDDVTRQRDEHLEQRRRLQAEFENFRKRTIRENTDLAGRATAGLVESLLPVLDSFEMALQSSSPDDPMHEGLSAVCAQLIEVLGKEGLERLEPHQGVAFDPETMQPVAHHPDGDAEGGPVVSGLLRPGYRLKGSLLRASMVEVKG